MKNLNLKYFVYALVALSAVAWLALAYLAKLNLSQAGNFLRLLPTVVTVDLFVIAIFLKWGWRWRIFSNWLVPFPDLNGTWKGELISDWIVPERGERVPAIPAVLTIKQTFFGLSCVVRTAEMVSYSNAEGFVIEADRQVKWLTYTYTSKPRILLADRSKQHDGTAVLEIIQGSDAKLVGKYWTDRKTTGEMRFSYYSNKLLEELPADIGKHPMAS